MPGRIFSVGCVSWIDQQGLPIVNAYSAAVSWEKKTVIGLLATSNPTPPTDLTNLQGFLASRQFRGLTFCTTKTEVDRGYASEKIENAGYTPPFDSGRLNADPVTRLVMQGIALASGSNRFHAGEASALSSIEINALHRCSTLKHAITLEMVRRNKPYSVIVNGLKKFRAGEHTNSLGRHPAIGSPFNVPWVWHEFAVVYFGGSYVLFGTGSNFPSHKWYIQGRQVADKLQDLVIPTEGDPALSTGTKGDAILPADADLDSSKPVNTHVNTIAGSTVQVVDITQIIRNLPQT